MTTIYDKYYVYDVFGVDDSIYFLDYFIFFSFHLCNILREKKYVLQSKYYTR